MKLFGAVQFEMVFLYFSNEVCVHADIMEQGGPTDQMLNSPKHV